VRGEASEASQPASSHTLGTFPFSLGRLANLEFLFDQVHKYTMTQYRTSKNLATIPHTSHRTTLSRLLTDRNLAMTLYQILDNCTYAHCHIIKFVSASAHQHQNLTSAFVQLRSHTWPFPTYHAQATRPPRQQFRTWKF
jgi:hypothetical protein